MQKPKPLAIKKIAFKKTEYSSLSVTMTDKEGHHASTQLVRGDDTLHLKTVVERYNHVLLEGLGVKGRIIDLNGDNPSDLFFLIGSRLYYQESFWRGTNFIADLRSGQCGSKFMDNDGIDGHVPAWVDINLFHDTLYVTFSPA